MATRASIISGSRRSLTSGARKEFRIDGLDDIQKRLARIVDAATGKLTKDVYYDAGKLLRDAARAKAPYGTTRTAGTHLRDAIFVDRGDETKANVLVGVRYRPDGAPHGHLVEYGSHGKPAQPYMRPAIASTGRAVASTIEQGLRKIIEDAAKK